MTGIARQLNRAFARHKGVKIESKPHHVDVQVGHYNVLHPTRGWKRVSYARLEAQRKMQEIFAGRSPGSHMG